MGSVAATPAAGGDGAWHGRRGSGAPRVRVAPAAADRDALELAAWSGEIVGLAGLEGHGQARLLERLFASSRRRDAGCHVDGRMALVAGDRQNDGVFPLWSIGRNVTIGSLAERARHGFVDEDAEREVIERWWKRIAIRTPDMDDPITSLSGGNQQKALFARALETSAGTVLMNDPMRGVDIGTKREVYALVRAESDAGRTFLWYTTEMDELGVCDHVYVFRDGRVVAGFARDEADEERVLGASFGDVST